MSGRWGRAATLAAALLVVPLAAGAITLPDWLNFSSDAADATPPRPVVTEFLADRDGPSGWVPGIVASKTQVVMAFQALGRMVRRHVDLGDRVTQGDVLAELATDDLAATTRAARAAVDAAEVQMDTAARTLARTQALVRRGVASTAQMERAQQAATGAEAALARARSELVQAEDAEGHASMIAAFTGVVSAIYEQPGAVVSAGAPVLQLSAEDGREVVIDLPETALVGLPEDAVFSVWQRDAAENEVPAILDRIDPLADLATRTRRLYLTLPDDVPFRLGALVRARLGMPGAPALTLPAEAVFARDGETSVWRVLREGDSARVEAVAVTLSPEFQGRVLVHDGLQAGDEIVIRGVASLTDGQAVGRRVDP